MSFNEWRELKLKDFILFNPNETIKKGTIAKKIPMEMLSVFQRKIDGFELSEYKGGTKFKNGDTLMARITPCLENGKIAQVTILDKDEIAFGSTEYIVLREKEGYSLNDFVYYLSISPLLREVAIKSMTGTSGRQRAQKDVIQNTVIKVPPLEEQKSIAHILSTLDQKIEVNNQINKTLEAMAQAIFKQWFIDFEFPNDNGEPYKLSGGEMAESEMGMIPKGWTVGRINDISEVTDFVANGSFASLKENVKYTDEESYAVLIRLVDYNSDFNGSFTWVDEKGYNYLKKSKLFGGEIIISNVGANAGMVFRAPTLDSPMTLGPNSIMLKINNYTDYLYNYLLSHVGQEKLNSIKGGSAQPKFNKTDFRNINLVIPNELTINKFNSILKAISFKIGNLDKEIKKLALLRDTLLPKLMLGEIRVPTDYQ